MTTKRKTVTIMIGALILFIWNALSWMVLPFHSNTLKSIPENAFDTAMLQENLIEDGVYHYPGIPNDNSDESFKEMEHKLKAGPRITLMVYKKGETEFFNPKTLILNLVFNLLTVVVLLSIVSQFKNKAINNVIWKTRLIGLLIGLDSDLPQMNWYMFPVKYTFVNIMDHLVSFLLLGLLFGLFTFKNFAENE